jgi:glycosyltransferase involved in cell wall biosynthesis
MPTRVTRWKGHEVMIDAAEIAMRTHAGKFLVIMAGSASGREAFRDSLLARIAERGLEQHVLLTGHEEDMPAALLACDVAATPSIEPEAFGRSAVEAMAMERPVIASRLGGFLETIVEGRTGLFVPPGDGAALAAAMTGLIDADPAGRAAMGAAGLARVGERYSKSALQAATLKVYERLLAGRR